MCTSEVMSLFNLREGQKENTRKSMMLKADLEGTQLTRASSWPLFHLQDFQHLL